MTGWLAGNMAWASVTMLAVLLLRQPLARLFGASIAYAAWLLPALRLVLPPLPAWHVPIPSLAPPETLVVFVEGSAAPLPPTGGPGQWVPVLLAIWAGGAAAFLGWQWLAWRRFAARIAADAVPAGRHRGIEVVKSGGVEGPVAIGFLRRRIVVPADFETRYAPVERRLALDHEAVHHRRGDLWWNLAALLALALNWFSPLAWIAFRAFRADQELACDAAVAAGADPETRHAYARALVKSASRPGVIAACPLHHADQLKRRLKMMKEHRRSRTRLLGGIGALALAGGVALALATPGAAQTEPPAPPTPPTPEAHEAGTRHVERIEIRTIRERDEEAREEGAAGNGETRRERRRIVILNHDGPAPEGVTRFDLSRCGDEARTEERTDESGRRTRIIECRRPVAGADEHVRVLMHRCPDDRRVEVNEGDERDRFRLILCGDDLAGRGRQAEALQRARDRLARDADALPAERREQILAAIDRTIERLRAQRTP